MRLSIIAMALLLASCGGRPSPAKSLPVASAAPVVSLDSPAKSSRKSAAVQCSIVLKSGARCSRRTTDPSGLCGQHLRMSIADQKAETRAEHDGTDEVRMIPWTLSAPADCGGAK